MSMDWDNYFLHIACVVRLKSKDPSTKIGAVIVGADHNIISTGFNGFPRGVSDHAWRYEDRPTKYALVEHAERNAIYNAARHGIRLESSTLYMVSMGPPVLPCSDCAKGIIQSGIKRLVVSAFKPLTPGWEESFASSSTMLNEAGIYPVEIDFSEVLNAS